MSIESSTPTTVVDETPGLSQVERVTNIFFAPSKTFEDIRNKNRSWWMPVLLFVIVGTALFLSVTYKIGWDQVYENGLRLSPSQAERLASLPPDQVTKMKEVSAKFSAGIWGLAPLLLVILGFISSGIYLGTINFVFGGKAKYFQVMAVGWYASIPMLFKLVMGIIMIWIGMAPEAFLPQNAGPTNLGFIFMPPAVSMLVFSLLVTLDVTTIWALILQSKGLSIVAGVKQSAGYITIFGWWLILTLINVGITAAFS